MNTTTDLNIRGVQKEIRNFKKGGVNGSISNAVE